MLPPHESFRHFTGIKEFPISNLPDLVHSRECTLFMGKYHGNSLGSCVELTTQPFFFTTVKRTEGFIKQQEIVLTGKDAGEVETLQFPPAQGKW